MLAHVDMDAFYASVEVLDDPTLAGRPVIVGGSDRGVVTAASYEARRYGVHSAMPIFQARRLCPQGVYVRGRMERYVEVSRTVMATLRGFTPLVEPVSVDEAYLDLAGTQGLWGPPPQAGRAIKAAVKEATGLTCSVGLAPVRFLAKIASDRDKPDGLCVVADLEEFLATVALKEVPGVGKKAQARLADMGIKRLTEVRALGEERIAALMGAFGARLWELAYGVDETGVSLEREVKSVSNERTLAADTGDRELLAAHLLKLSQKVCRRLRAKGLAGRTVTLKLKYADHRLITRRATLAGPTDDVGEVFPAARDLLKAHAPAGPYRLIGVGVSGLMPAESGQAGLFDGPRRERAKSLARAEDAIAARFGEAALTRAGSLPALDSGPKGGHNGSRTSPDRDTAPRGGKRGS